MARINPGGPRRPGADSDRARILLVDDDDRLGGALAGYLRQRHYEVAYVRTARAAFDHHALDAQDAVLLELRLPDGDGLEVCRRLRSTSDAGIIIVTGRAGHRERVAGLRAGADDYVLKPYVLPELHARIDAVLRRSRRPTNRRTQVGTILVDVDARSARVGGRPLQLTAKEFGLLVLLTRYTGCMVARTRLAAEVWPGVRFGSSRTLDVHISNLRAKLGSAAVIEAVHGLGYRLDPAR
jgi:DNA-binding response OmpR family regulator